jgi:peroxiredoxin
MKKLIYLLVFSLVQTICVGQLEPEKILDSLLIKLHSLDELEYTIHSQKISKHSNRHEKNSVVVYQEKIKPDSLFDGRYIATDFSDGYIYKDLNDSIEYFFDGDSYVMLRNDKKEARIYDNTIPIEEREYYISPYPNRSPALFYLERQLKFYKDKGYKNLFDRIRVEELNDFYQIHLNAFNRNIALGTVNMEAEYHTLKTIKVVKGSFLPQEYNIALVKSQADTTYILSMKYSNFRSKKQSINPLESIPMDFEKEYFDPNPNPKNVKTGTHLPSWTLPELNSDSISLTNLRNSRVLIQFTSVNCGVCIKSIPFINKMYRLTHKIDSIELYTIFPLSKDPQELKKHINKRGLKAPVLYDASIIRKEYGVTAFPTFMVINKDGIIEYINPGYSKDYEKEIKENWLKE